MTQVPRSEQRLAVGWPGADTRAVAIQPAWGRGDVEAILGALFDIRAALARLVELVEGDDEGEAEADS